MSSAPEVHCIERGDACRAHKKTEIPWLRLKPKHWDVRKLKHLVRFQGGGTPSKDEMSFWNGDIPWVSPKDMKQHVICDTEDHITENALLDSATSMVQPGSVLVVVRSGILKHSLPLAINDVPVTLNQDMKALIPLGPVSSQFLKWSLKGLSDQVLFACRKIGATVDSLDMELFNDFPLPCPSSTEQLQIISFLERETAKLDALLEKKHRLFELLQEKRQALITQAVTKGLDPNVALKDSGVPWLGEVPSHWDIIRLGTAAEKMTNGYVGPTRDLFVEDGGVRYLQSLHIKGGKIDFEKKEYYVPHEWSQQQNKSILRTGDVVFVQTGDIGQVAVIPSEFDGVNCHALIIVRMRTTLAIGEYVSWFFQSTYGQNILLSYRTGALHPHLDTGRICDIKIVLPTLDEQNRISQYVEAATERIDQLLSKIELQIHNLMEYRRALISAAVTGQIDVRQYKTNESEVAIP